MGGCTNGWLWVTFLRRLKKISMELDMLIATLIAEDPE